MGFLHRFRRAPAEPPRTPAQQRADVADDAAELIATGFVSRERAAEVLSRRIEHDQDRYPSLGAEDADEILAEVWERRSALEAGWPDEGDYGRLAAAFRDLEARGIVARMNFTCCGSCGYAEIGDERAADSRGYVFFHQQDVEGVVAGDPEMILSHGAFTSHGSIDHLADTRLGAEVVDALKGRGLRVEWDGSAEQRIRLQDLDWRKRLPVD